MNIIVTNKCRNLIYSTNIEVLKEITGVFKVSQIVNSFNSIFYKKIIVDATALEGFPKENVLKELVSAFDSEKLILLLPPDNPPPKKFLSFLVSINLFNFTDNPNGLVELTRKSNTYNDVSSFVIESETVENENNEDVNLFDQTEAPGRVVIGFRSVTENSYSSEIIYMLKRTLEEIYKKDVLAVEVNKNNFVFYNSPNMHTISGDKLSEFLKNNLGSEVILVDLDDNQRDGCDDVLNLVNPSLFEVNKLMYKSRDAFIKLKGEKVIFVNSLLSTNDVNQFAKEANITVYYNLPPLNDRIHNQQLDNLLIKLGFVNEKPNKTNKKGLFNLFK